MKTRLILLGPPGSGKGTYASRIEQALGFPQISTGDLLRDAVARQTQLGKEAKQYMESGQLVPDELVIAMVKERLSQPDAQRGFVLDGFPRTLAQARALDQVTKIDLVVDIDVPEQVIVERLGYRVTCKNCNAIYNLKTLPPKKPGVCDKCGGPLFQRKDDSPEVIRQRFRTYKEQSTPLVEYYKDQDLLQSIASERANVPPEQMVEKIIELMR